MNLDATMPETRSTDPMISRGTARAVARRGNNHARAAAATTRGLLAALLLALALALPAPARAQATPEGNPLVQRGVPAEATAENAVIARDRALAAGQRLAYQRMAGQLGLPTGLSDSQIEAMVQSLIIESERITPRGYSAQITVNFNPARVRGGAMAGAPGAGPPGAPVAPARGPAVATVEAVALYRSFPEWVEITRRLRDSPAVARTEIVAFSGEAARLRLALRSQPPEAATELAGAGLALEPAAMEARPGEGWRLGLAGGR
jgi:hypothetical protein